MRAGRRDFNPQRSEAMMRQRRPIARGARHRALMSAALSALCSVGAACGGCEDAADAPPKPDAGLGDPKDQGGDLAPQDAGADAQEADLGPQTTCRPRPAGQPVTYELGDWSVILREGDGQWEVRDAGRSVMRGPGACEAERAAARVADGQLPYRESFGQYRIRMDSPQLGWIELDGEVVPEQVSPDQVRLRYRLLGRPQSSVWLVFARHGQGDLRVALETDLPGAVAGELSMRCDPQEDFFGLGTQSYAMTLRGGKFPLWTQEQGIGKPDNGGLFPLNNVPEAAYAPMGVWHSSQGYTALVTHDSYSELELCKGQPDRVTLRSYKEQPGMVLVSGESLGERLTRAAKGYLGLPASMPPDWAFAPWNDAVGGPERLAQVALALRQAQIPSSAIWSEDWIGGEQTATGFRLSYAWEWSPQTYPDLPADIRQLHAQGFAFLAYFNTFVPQPTRMWAEGLERGFLIKTQDDQVYTFQDPAFRTATLVDLTNPAARQWMSDYKRTAALDLGIDGWMADFSEWLPVTSKLHSAEDAWLVHNRYPVEYQKINREVMEQVHGQGEAANDWLFFSRSGWASAKGGSASVASIIWAGDQDTDWDYDDGLPTVIPIGAHVGLSGLPFYGSDIAGYTSLQAPNTNKELFYRWASLGSLSPIMRTHHGSDKCGNWTFDRDPETTQHYKRWASIHTMMLPLWQVLSQQALETGWPIMRHPYMVQPQLPALWRGLSYQYFIGQDLLVAPVLAKGATQREVALPAQGSPWWPLLGDSPLAETAAQDGEDEGVRVVTALAPATELPAFVRPGTTLGLLPEAVDTFYGATAPGVRDLSQVQDHYLVAMYPDASGQLREAQIAPGVVTSGEGWRARSPLAWAQATLNGQALPSCAQEPAASCVDADLGLLKVVGRSGQLAVPIGPDDQRATLRWSASRQITLHLRGVGGLAAFGPWAAATTLTDLDPQIPAPCK